MSQGVKNVFVVLDGIDGCGKSTQARRLVARFEREFGARPVHVRDPGTTAVGERVRAILLDRELELAAGTEALLFCAARAQMLAETIAPALAEGRTVICERFHAATFAYQAVAGGLNEADVLALLRTWAGAPRPDLELILELPPERAAERRSTTADRIEAKGLEFQRRVAAGMARYAELVPHARRIDALGTQAEVEERIFAEVRRALVS
ncbi:MAG: dTMP kinase [Planctomycetes bacterium]|nr:dTMP kinase [Planctomycetota bacterium]